MQIILNGETKLVENGWSVADLVNSFDVDPRGIAIELNREILPKSEHVDTLIQEGDQLEVVQFVGGG